MARVLVIGIGNPLLADDGVGVHAAQCLAGRAGGRDGVTILDAGTLSFPLLPVLRGAAGLIVIDAVQAGGRPGEVSIREGEAFDRFVDGGGCGRHGRRLAELIAGAREGGQLPPQRVLIGIEPALVDWGLELSPAVAGGVPRCIDVALDFIDRWQPGGATAH